MATKKFSDYAVEGQNVTLTYDNVNDTVTFDVVVDKSDVGLGNVDNTSDANKPISTATQTALNLKQNSLVSGTNIKTINSNTLLGSGDVVIDKTSIGLSNVTNVDTTNASNISSGTLGDARLSANVTLQGNTFNAANKLVQLDGTAKLPAVDGSQLTNLPTPATPTLASVTTAGNTTTNAITVGGLTVDTNTLFVDATNNRVGIGTVTPSQPLHIIGRTRIASSTGTSLHLYNDGSTSLIDSLTNANAAHDLRISAQNISFYSGASYGTVYAKLFNTGNFALGSNPTDAGYKLDVNGTARVSGNTSISAGNLSIFTTNTPRRINVQQGNGSICSTFGMYDGGGSLQAAFGLETVSTNALQIASTAAIRFYSGSVIGNAVTEPTNERMRLFSTGNLAINTTTDSGYKLDVNGTARVSGVINANPPTNGAISISLNGGTLGTYLSHAANGVNTFDLGSEYAIFGSGTGTDSAVVARANRKLFLGSNGLKSIFCDAIGSVGITLGAAINTSAIFQVDSTTKGVLFPRMTTTQKNAIATPAAGLVVYDTTLSKLCVYTSAWETITSI